MAPRFAPLALLVLAAPSCGGDEATLDQARILIRRGDLERAELQLAVLDSAESGLLRAEIEDVRARRVRIDAELARIRASIGEDRAIDLRNRLRALRRGEEDPVSREAIEVLLSDFADLLVEAAPRRSPEALPDASPVAGLAPRGEEPYPGPPLAASEVPVDAAADTPADAAADTPAEASRKVADPEDPHVAIGVAESLVRATAEERDALFSKLLAGGHTDLLRVALHSRWTRDLSALRSGDVLDALRKLMEDRRRLDEARRKALDLISDEDTYFYPYEPPECPPERARIYPAVQRVVTGRVEALRALWNGKRTVSLQGELRAALESLRWNRRCQSEANLDFGLPADLPAAVWALPRRTERLGLRDFAWDSAERESHETSRAVRERNRELWEWAGGLTDEYVRPRREEKELVRLTNDYRQMFGLNALAWNPNLQEAATIHSVYMEAQRMHGHEELDPERRTPGHRLLLVGYHAPGTENITAGPMNVQAAFESWTGSSGHHRNLLEAEHLEMATARRGIYWTQVFGTDGEFLSELERWRD